jgi:cell division protein ZipA
MDLSVRDWLIIIGALLALAVLLDGYRRMHKDRRDTIRLTPKARRDVDEDLINPELPSSARVIAVREEKSLHLKRAVDSRPAKPPRHEPTVATEETEDDNNILFTDPAEEYNPKPSAGIDEDEDRDVAAGWSNSGDDFDAEDVAEELPRHSEKPVIEDRPSSLENKTHKTAQTTSSPHQELLVLNVMAQDKSPFKGSDLLQILMAPILLNRAILTWMRLKVLQPPVWSFLCICLAQGTASKRMRRWLKRQNAWLRTSMVSCVTRVTAWQPSKLLNIINNVSAILSAANLP